MKAAAQVLVLMLPVHDSVFAVTAFISEEQLVTAGH